MNLNRCTCAWTLFLLAACGAGWQPYRIAHIPAATRPEAAFDAALQYAREQGYSLEVDEPNRGLFCVRTKGCVGPGQRSSFCVQVFSNGELSIEPLGVCVASGTMYYDIRAEYVAFAQGIEAALPAPARAHRPHRRPPIGSLDAPTRPSPASPDSAALSSQPPSGAAAFDFGATPETLMRSCIKAGNRWSTTGTELASCSGPVVDLGFPAEVQVGFENDRAVVVAIVRAAESDGEARLAELKSALDGKYGEAVTVEARLPQACKAAAFAACLSNGAARIEYLWRWRTGESISLSAGRSADASAKPEIVVRYAKHAMRPQGPGF